MRKYIFWGILLIVFGIFWLFKTLNIIDFCWKDVWSLWPLILIWIGIGLLPIKEGYKITLDLLIMAVGFFILLKPDCCEWKTPKKKFVEERFQTASATFVFDDEIKEANLHIQAAVSEIDFESRKLPSLIYVKGTNPEWIDIQSNSSENKANINLNIGKNGHNVKLKDSKLNEKYTVVLDPDMLWNMNVNIGAADIDIDLSDFKVKNFSLDAGAADIDLKFGSLYPEVHAEINIGVSDLNLKLPENMNCRIEKDGGLNDWDINGFTIEKKGVYFAPAILHAGDSTISGNIYIKISSGVSSISIERY
jgi:hypothetical protein